MIIAYNRGHSKDWSSFKKMNKYIAIWQGRRDSLRMWMQVGVVTVHLCPQLQGMKLIMSVVVLTEVKLKPVLVMLTRLQLKNIFPIFRFETLSKADE